MMDNYDIWEAHDIAQERWRESRPVCASCGEHIQDEYMYETLRGILCEECARAYSEDLAEEYRLDIMGEWRKEIQE